MKKKVRWGILGAANIALKKVVPAMQRGEFCEISAIASRDESKAKAAAESLGIPKFYGSYEEIFADPEIEAVYIPLPNHLHFEYSRRAAEAGKHVLCEKPVTMTVDEIRALIDVRSRTGVKIQEAFMVRTHPQWLKVRELIGGGRIGRLQAITGFFSYNIPDPANVRNNRAMGGGCLMDIGCYCINLARFIFESEAQRVSGLIERDAETGIDTLTSAMLEFPNGRATFTCAARAAAFQRMEFFGDRARLEVEIPFNIPPDAPTRIYIDDGADLFRRSHEALEIPAANQYTIQGDLFSKSILENTPQAISLEDSFNNMAAIEAIFRASESGRWETPAKL